MPAIDYERRYMEAAKNDYKYLDHTAQGLPVLKLFQNKYGFLEVISKNNSGYIVGHHYDPATGQWVNGIYGFDRYTDATEYIFDNYVIRNVFDPSSPIDVRMEYAGKFNYNHTSQDYLSKHNHHDPDFDIYDHLSPFNEYGYNGGRKPTREEFEGYLTKYRKANQPTRSMNVKRSKIPRHEEYKKPRLAAYDTNTGREIPIGSIVTDSRGDRARLEYLDRANEFRYGGRRSGKVGVTFTDGNRGEYYDNVFNLEVRDLDLEEKMMKSRSIKPKAKPVKKAAKPKTADKKKPTVKKKTVKKVRK